MRPPLRSTPSPCTTPSRSTLTAKFLDPDSQYTGKVTFEVCTTNNCSSSLGTFDSTSTTLAVNANGSAAVPASSQEATAARQSQSHHAVRTLLATRTSTTTQ